MTLVLGVDFSEGDDITQSTIDAWKAAGVGVALIQYSQKLPTYLQQMAHSGIPLEAYVYLYFPVSPWNQTPESRVQACLNMLRGYPVSRVWLDVEDPNDNDTPANITAALTRCVDLVEAASYQAGIYTGRYKFPERVGNTQVFARLPLWHADYINRAPTQADFDAWQGYNGWTRPLIWQWGDTQDFGGHSVDMNTMEVDDVAKEHYENELDDRRARELFTFWTMQIPPMVHVAFDPQGRGLVVTGKDGQQALVACDVPDWAAPN